MSASSSQSWGRRDDVLLSSSNMLLSYYPDEGPKVCDLMPRTPYSSKGSRLQQRRERGAASSRISVLHPPRVAAASVVHESGTCTELLGPVPSDESALLVEGS